MAEFYAAVTGVEDPLGVDKQHSTGIARIDGNRAQAFAGVIKAAP
ncbi:hypothetical protein CRENPOLYSF2_2670008 [Crenothrix polyspora]|uniref:Uncharacterized protein n=1 Tax=Crenothrix polyspora TaxID=360316 RepID=A0A1R4H7Y5_9GAMM|nr:hypothetical protein CRENPOLYSF2_2670008 [Crenothrix polyspora]